MQELKDGVEAYAAGKKDLAGTNDVFAHPLPFNVIPHIDTFQVKCLGCYCACLNFS